MKKIIVVAKYDAWVDDHVKVSEVQDNIDQEIRGRLDQFSVEVPNYADWVPRPHFHLEDVRCGTFCMISMGGND